MPVLVEQAAVGGEGGRAMERGLSVMVDRGVAKILQARP